MAFSFVFRNGHNLAYIYQQKNYSKLEELKTRVLMRRKGKNGMFIHQKKGAKNKPTSVSEMQKASNTDFRPGYELWLQQWSQFSVVKKMIIAFTSVPIYFLGYFLQYAIWSAIAFGIQWLSPGDELQWQFNHEQINGTPNWMVGLLSVFIAFFLIEAVSQFQKRDQRSKKLDK